MEGNSLQPVTPYRSSASETMPVQEFFHKMRDSSEKILIEKRQEVLSIEEAAKDKKNRGNHHLHMGQGDIEIKVANVSDGIAECINKTMAEVSVQVDIMVKLEKIMALVRNEVMDLQLNMAQVRELSSLIKNRGNATQVAFIAAAWLNSMAAPGSGS
jgi:hypothetical protein